MKNGLIKKALCVFIAAVFLIIPLTTVSFAGSRPAEAAESDEADCPYIFVHGFMGSTVYKDPGDPDSEAVWPPTGTDIKNAVKAGIPAFLKLAITHNWEKFGDEAVKIATDLFSSSFLAPDGTAADGSGVRWEYPKPEEITKSSSLNFRYDWRLSPIETAEKLADFIDYVLACSGCEQVVLECHSYGGVIAVTYARMFGVEKIRSWAFNSNAVYGEAYNGELFTGQMKFDPEALTSYLDGVFDHNKNEKFFDFLFKALYKTGITGLACKLVNRMTEKIGMKKLSEGIIPMFGGWLSIWAMIPDEMIEDSYDFVFDYVWGDDPTDRSGLQEKIIAYNENIRPYKTETLMEIDRTSNLYVFARYGYSGFFMTPSWKNETDTVIDLKYASFGATAAPHGKVLTDEQLAAADAKYVSPGKNINAATCLFPEQTWFINHMSHSESFDSFDEMIKTLLYHKGQATTETFEQYPRYVLYNETNDMIEAEK